MIASIPSKKHYMRPPEPPFDDERQVALVMLFSLALALFSAALTY